MSTDESDLELPREMLRKAKIGRSALFSRTERGPFESRDRWSSLNSEDSGIVKCPAVNAYIRYIAANASEVICTGDLSEDGE